MFPEACKPAPYATQSHVHWVMRTLSTEVKQPESKAEHFPQSISEITKCFIISSHDMQRDDLYLYIQNK
jgi:hypothetical protein